MVGGGEGGLRVCSLWLYERVGGYILERRGGERWMEVVRLEPTSILKPE